MSYDVAIVGGGPGGYACAIRCGQLGLETVLIEEAELGGICLHWGCIPTKSLYVATKLLIQTETADEMGLTVSAPKVDLLRLAAWKDGVVSRLTDGIETLLERNGVEVVYDRGRLAGSGRIALSAGETIEADRIVLATGSHPIEIPGFAFDDVVWSSDDALALPEVPDRLVVIGGGVIGLELATIYRRLGSEVTVVELLPEILSIVDLDRRTIAVLKRALKASGIDVRTGTRAESLETSDNAGGTVHLDDGDRLEADRILLAVGRRSNADDIGLETVGIEADDAGFVRVDDRLETTAKGVFAIGDLAPGPMLAHKASAEGIALADSFDGAPIDLDHDGIPQAIFTDPEIASAGLSETRARENERPILVGRCAYAVLGKAVGMREPDGFFQVVADEDDHRILGVQIIGAEASDLISEAALAIRNGLTLERLIETVHPHPTLPEGLKEAAENALGRAIHTVNR